MRSRKRLGMHEGTLIWQLPTLSRLAARGTHGPSGCSAYRSVTGRRPMYLSVAVQATASLGPSLSVATVAERILTTGAVKSTSTQTWGTSPGFAAGSPGPRWLRATDVKP